MRYTVRRMLGSVAMILVASAATGAEAQQAAPAEEPESTDTQAGEIVVTGSRIRNDNQAQASPIVELSQSRIADRGVVNVVDALVTVPAVSTNSFSPTGSPTNTLGAGLFTIDLRGLGSQRTLVLVDGRRYPTSQAQGFGADISTIPADLIERVDVLTGGGSAVYGSDAMSGVVNFVIRNNVRGLLANGQIGITSRGDGRQWRVSLSGGTGFAGGRGDASFYVGYDETAAISALDREVSSDAVLITNPQRPDLAIFGPAARSASSNSQQGVFGLNGSTIAGSTVRRTVLADGTITTPLASRDTDNPQRFNLVNTPLRRLLTFARLRYDVTEDIRFFTDQTYARTQNLQQLNPTFITSGALNIGGATGIPVTIPASNPFIPAGLLALIPAGRTEIAVGRIFPEFGPRQENYTRDLYRGLAGLEGDLPGIGEGWHWEAYYSYARSTTDFDWTGGINTQRFYDSQRVEPDGAGGLRCANPAARAQGCIPVNLFTGTRLTAAEVNYLATDDQLRVVAEQQVAAASLTGRLLQLPGGPLSFAVGAEYRRESGRFEPDNQFISGTSSLQFLTPTRGQFDVKEVYGEVSAPLLRDLPFASRLDFEAAYRYADYSRSGGISAWKIGGNYAPISDIRFRATYSRDVRAPTIADLFAGTTFGGVNLVDPCRNGGGPEQQAYCSSQPGVNAGFNPPNPSPTNGINSGNLNLGPEIGKTLTAGVVLAPRWLPGLSMTADYFEIRINDAIGSIPAQTQLNLCAATNDPRYCEQIIRDPVTGILTTINSTPINVATQRMRGVDVELAYQTPLTNVFGARLGDRLDIALNYIRLIAHELTAFSGSATTDLLGQPLYPRHRANLNVRYANGPVSITLNERYIGQVSRIVGASFPGNAVSDAFYTDIQVRIEAGERYSFYLGARNLFDRDPPLFPGTYVGGISSINTAGQVYDLTGRFLYSGVTVRF